MSGEAKEANRHKYAHVEETRSVFYVCMCLLGDENKSEDQMEDQSLRGTGIVSRDTSVIRTEDGKRDWNSGILFNLSELVQEICILHACACILKDAATWHQHSQSQGGRNRRKGPAEAWILRQNHIYVVAGWIIVVACWYLHVAMCCPSWYLTSTIRHMLPVCGGRDPVYSCFLHGFASFWPQTSGFVLVHDRMVGICDVLVSSSSFLRCMRRMALEWKEVGGGDRTHGKQQYQQQWKRRGQQTHHYYFIIIYCLNVLMIYWDGVSMHERVRGLIVDCLLCLPLLCFLKKCSHRSFGPLLSFSTIFYLHDFKSYGTQIYTEARVYWYNLYASV